MSSPDVARDSLQKKELPEVSMGPAEKSPYDGTFLAVYFANIAFMLSYSQVFRYSDFVKTVGGTDIDVSLIIAFAGVGSMIVRFWLGQFIDQFGARWIWLASILLWIFGLFWTSQISDLRLFPISVSRFVMQCGIAGFFGSSLTFISLRIPPKRLAEVLGILGTAGFLGMGLGPYLGDYLMSGFDQMDNQMRKMLVSRMFASSILCGFASLVFVVIASTKPPTNIGSKTNQSLLSALKTHRPTWILLFGLLMGVGLSIPSTFLRPMMEAKGIEGIKVFFMWYNITAISLRILTKNLPNQIGLPKMIAIGMFFLGVTYPVLLTVSEPWMLAFPAIAGGAAHSFLFPSIIAIFSHHFPANLRGTATTLALGMNDAGTVIGALFTGLILRATQQMWPNPAKTSDYTLVNWAFAVVFFIAIGLALTKLKNPIANEKPGTKGLPSNHAKVQNTDD